jgi:hypothetical protein
VTDRRTLRVAGAAAILGAACHLVASILEPDWQGDPGEAVRIVSDSGFFIGDRVLDVVGLFLIVGALTVIARTLPAGRGRAWASVGQPFLLLMAALWAGAVVTCAALKEIADAWASAAPESKQAYLAAFDATASVTDALYWASFLALGLYLLALAAAILAGGMYGRWIGWLAAAGGALWISGDLLSLAFDLAFVAVLAGSLLFLTVLVALGVTLWRHAAGRPRLERLVVTALAASAAAALTLAGSGRADGGAPRAGIGACTPGPRLVRGFQARVFCGPARATVVVNRRRFAFENGVCERHRTYFLVNIGTVVTGIGKSRPKLPYLGLLMGRSPAYAEPVVNKPGTYRKGTITLTSRGLQVDLHNEEDLRITIGPGMRSGTFSATKPGSAIYGIPTYKVAGSFTC